MNDLHSLSTWTQAEYHFDKMERALTYTSATVVLAPLAGPLKFLIGTITILTCAILRLYAHVTANEKLGTHAYSLIRHGAGNMAAGIAETIPFVGLASLIHRYYQLTFFNLSRGGIYIDTKDQDKYMPYESIARQNFKITSGVEGSTPELKQTREKFKEKYPTAQARDKASLNEMRADVARWADDAIQQLYHQRKS